MESGLIAKVSAVYRSGIASAVSNDFNMQNSLRAPGCCLSIARVLGERARSSCICMLHFWFFLAFKVRRYSPFIFGLLVAVITPRKAAVISTRTAAREKQKDQSQISDIHVHAPYVFVLRDI